MMPWFAIVLICAGVKVGGVEFVPKDLVFASADPRSRATADGALADECKWEFISETRVGRHEDSNACVRYYYRTTVTLTRSCPQVKLQRNTSERITSTGPHCPDSSGKVAPPQQEARALSSGTTPDGKHQDIVVQPDGTRITLLSDATGAAATVVYPDGSVDTVVAPAAK